MIYLIIFLISALILLLWQISQMISVISGAPTIYAKNKTIRKAFELAGLKQGQTVIDLGCGDAKSLIIAAKEFGTRGIGVEISPFYFLLSKIKVLFTGESKNIKIIFGRFQKAESYLKSADVVYLYLFEKLLAEIEPWLFQAIRPGTNVISIGFQFKNKKPIKKTPDPVLFLFQK